MEVGKFVETGKQEIKSLSLKLKELSNSRWVGQWLEHTNHQKKRTKAMILIIETCTKEAHYDPFHRKG